MLPAILARHTALPVAHAADGDRLTAGRVLIVPPGQHKVDLRVSTWSGSILGSCRVPIRASGGAGV